jgi:transposase-like protein
MLQETNNGNSELEQLRRRFEEFRSANPPRTRFPQPLWLAAAELAKSHGLNATARFLNLALPSLRNWMDRAGSHQGAAERADVAPTLVELIAPVTGVTNCTIEVEASEGLKLRLELRAVATRELANLVRAFVGR